MSNAKEEVIFPKETLYGAWNSACDKFRKALLKSSSAQEYLGKRGISEETINKFGIGYAPNEWDFISNMRFVEEEGYPLEVLESAGLVIKTSETGHFYDRFRGRIIIPIFDSSGRIVSATARTLNQNEPVKYINGPETQIYKKGSILYGFNFSKKAIINSGQAIFVEGAIDLIQCFNNGINNVVAPCGTSLTEQQMRLVNHLRPGIEKILLFDGDTAGVMSATRACENFLGYDIKVAELPEDKDPDEILREGQSGPDILRLYVSIARGGFEFLFSQKTKEKVIPSLRLEDKIGIVMQFSETFSKLPYERRRIYSAELATQLSLPQEEVMGLLFPSSRNGSSEKSKYFWQSQIIKILVFQATKSRQNEKLTHLVEYCEHMRLEDLLTLREARAIYSCIRDNFHGLPLVELNSPLFRRGTEQEVVSSFNKKVGNIDGDRLLELLDCSNLVHLDGRKNVSHGLLEQAIKELTLIHIVTDLRKGFELNNFSLEYLVNLRKKISRGDINGSNST